LAGSARVLTTMVAAIPSSRAATATPRPWLPAEAATTGRPAGSAVRAATAPRSLNVPARLSVSTATTPRPAAPGGRRDGLSRTTTGGTTRATAAAAALSCAAVGGAT